MIKYEMIRGERAHADGQGDIAFSGITGGWWSS